MLHDGTQFLDTHLETTVAHETANGTVGGKGGSNSSGQAITHGTQTSTGTDATLLVIFEITGGKQLVLSNIRHEHSTFRSLLGNSIDHLAHQQRTLFRMDGRLYDLFALLLIQFLERIAPLLMVSLIKQSGKGWQRLFTVCHHSHIGLYVLVNLTLVDIQMYNLGLLGVGLRIACHTVREAHANGYQHVTLLFLQVNGIVAMHTQHTHIQRMVGRQGTQSQHGTTGRDVCFLQESLQFLLGISQFHALSY